MGNVMIKVDVKPTDGGRVTKSGQQWSPTMWWNLAFSTVLVKGRAKKRLQPDLRVTEVRERLNDGNYWGKS